jgi:membrane-associated HD superfamily phosphohydrolase
MEIKTIEERKTTKPIQKRCVDLVEEKYQDRLEQFEKAKKEEKDFFEYVNEAGLCFDRVEAGTFKDQRAGYWRWQLSWGGPSEEFRLFDNGDLEYWYLDWFDGACVKVQDEIFENIMANFKDLSGDACQ